MGVSVEIAEELQLAQFDVEDVIADMQNLQSINDLGDQMPAWIEKLQSLRETMIRCELWDGEDEEGAN